MNHFYTLFFVGLCTLSSLVATDTETTSVPYCITSTGIERLKAAVLSGRLNAERVTVLFANGFERKINNKKVYILNLTLAQAEELQGMFINGIVPGQQSMDEEADSITPMSEITDYFCTDCCYANRTSLCSYSQKPYDGTLEEIKTSVRHCGCVCESSELKKVVYNCACCATSLCIGGCIATSAVVLIPMCFCPHLFF